MCSFDATVWGLSGLQYCVYAFLYRQWLYFCKSLHFIFLFIYLMCCSSGFFLLISFCICSSLLQFSVPVRLSLPCVCAQSHPDPHALHWMLLILGLYVRVYVCLCVWACDMCTKPISFGTVSCWLQENDNRVIEESSWMRGQAAQWSFDGEVSFLCSQNGKPRPVWRCSYVEVDSNQHCSLSICRQ